jgi:N-alpha-acetyl-L-2,4-diaminobutyrate deacetylase
MPNQWNVAELGLRSRQKLAITTSDRIQIPFTVVCGSAHSPLALVMAGVHGDEFEGPAAIFDMMQEIDPERVTGSILFVPVANPASFRAGTRLHPDGGDLNRLFPGKPQGTPCEKLAHLLFEEFVRPASCILSMHGWSKEAEVLPYVEHSLRDQGTARDAAWSLNLPHVEAYDWPAGVLGKALENLAISIVETEIGGLGRITSEGQALSRSVIYRFLQQFEFVQGEPETSAHPRAIEHVDVFSSGYGLLRRSVDLGERVGAGQVLGKVLKIDGQSTQDVVAPIGGVVGIVRHFASVGDGNLLFRIYTEREAS